jgi:RNA polymerase sigma-70 factor (ECF subfamily)
VRATSADAYALALRLVGNEHDARDVLQDTYLRAFRSLRKFRGDSAFGTWLHRITVNCSATFVAKRRRCSHVELDDEVEVLEMRAETDPETAAGTADDRHRLVEALAGLPDQMRMVVVLRDVYDMPHEEIARELGITQTAAKVRSAAPTRASKRRTDMQLRFDQGLLGRLVALEGPLARASRARAESREVSCADVALALPSILDGGSAADEVVVEHVGECLRCQAELAKYRKLLRVLNQLRAARVEPPPGTVTDVLGAIEQAAQRRVIRSALTGRRLVYGGGLAAAAGAIVALTAARRGRLRRVRPVVLS